MGHISRSLSMVSGKLNVNDGPWGMDRRHKDEWIESLEGRRICYGMLVCYYWSVLYLSNLAQAGLDSCFPSSELGHG